MPVDFKVHSTAKRALAIVAFALLLSALLVGVRKLTAPNQSAVAQQSIASFPAPSVVAYIAPVVMLKVDDAARELNWSAALAAKLNGRVEVAVPNGRIDVLTDIYAIEVERLEKWHEGIGQASHYAISTGKVGCLALIIDSDKWPLNEATLAKLRTVEQTAVSRAIKLLILRRIAPEA